MASEGGGKIKSKRGHSSSKPYERRKSLFRRITDSIKDVLRPSWLSPEVSGDDGSVVLVGAEPIAASGGHHGDANSANPRQTTSHFPLQSEPVQPSAGGSQGDGREHNPPHPRSSGTEGIVQHPQSHLYNQHPNPLANARFGWQQQQQHQHPRQTTGPQQPQLQPNMMSHSDNSHLMRSYSTTGPRQRQGVGAWQTGAMEKPHGLTLAAASTSAFPGTQPRPRRLHMSDSEVSQTLPSTSSHTVPLGSDVDPSMLSGSTSLLGDVPSADLSPSASENSAAKRQRLWSPETPRKGRSLQPAVQDKPTFKISVFCSPNQSMNESLHESSFYSGKTTFGGASASRRRNLNTSLPYQNSLPLRNSVKARPLNSSNSAVLSSSAAQILKTLDRLSETKREQASETSTDSVLSFTPSSYRKPSRPLQTATPSRKLQLPSRGPPIGRLQTPAMASIARNHQVVSLPVPRQQSQPSATQTRPADDDDDDDVHVIEDVQERAGPRTDEQTYHDVPSGSGSGKMKRSKTYETRPKARKEDEEVVEVPNLRTDFTLPVQSMPSFNLGQIQSLPSASKPAAVTSRKDSSGTPSLQFTFSSPIHKSGPSPTGSTPVSTEGFQFSSPLRVAQTVPPTLDKSPVSMFGGTSSASGSGFGSLASPVWGSTAAKAKSTSFGTSSGKPANQLSEGLGASGTSSISVASASSSDSPPKPAAQLLSGSVMDVLGGGKSDAAAAASPPVSGVKPASSLRQGSVMDILGKGGSLSMSSTATESSTVGGIASKSSATTDDLFAKFKKPAGSWECGSCMVPNKAEDAKCVCCAASKPGTSSAGSSAPLNTPASTSAPSGGTDPLFAKFQKPAGAWDCDMCLVQNKADATKCVACDTPKPGSKPAAQQAPTAKTDDLFAKFRKPAGSWECDVCMVQNTEAQTRCLACEAPRPGTQSTGSMPSPGQGLSGTGPAPVIGPGGGLVLGMSSSSSSSSPSPFLTAVTAKTDSSTAGFSFASGGGKDSASTGFTFGGSGMGTTSSSGGFKFGNTTVSSSDVSDGGFKLPTGSSTTSKDSSGNAGFKFGDKDLSNSNSASPAAGVSFGKTDAAKSDSAPSASLSGGFKFGGEGASGTQAAGTGFQFGSSSAISSTGVSVGLNKATVASSGTSLAPAATSTTVTGGSSFGSLSGATGFAFGAPSPTTPATDSSKNNGFSTSDTGSATSESGKNSFAPVFGLGKPANNNSLGAAPSVMSGGFQFGASATSDSAGSSVFGSNLSSRVTFPTSEPAKTDSGSSGLDGAKQTGISGGFGFQTGAKPNNETTPQPGLFTSALSGKNGESGPTSGFAFGSAAATSSSAPSASGFVLGSGAATSTATTTATATPGFAFGSNTAITNNSTTSGFGAAPQQNSWSDTGSSSSLPKPELSGAKPTVNGEVGAPPGMFAFGQQPAGSSTTGFSFATHTNSSTENAVPAPKAMFAFGTDSSSTVAGGKRTLDQNDSGPSDAKKRGFFSGGSSAPSSSEPFKFGNPAPAPTTNSIFKFGQPTEGAADKAPNMPTFGGTAPAFGAAPQASLFASGQNSSATTQSVFGNGGGGAGTSTTGQFSFSMGTSSQGNAAAASAFSTEPASTGFGSSTGTGFNFVPNAAPSFNFAAGSNPTATPASSIFQFGSAPAADSAPVQPAAGSLFAFGQTAQPADSTTASSGFPTAPGMAFGAPGAPPAGSFTIGSGTESRKIKRAVRRGARK